MNNLGVYLVCRECKENDTKGIGEKLAQRG